MIALLATLSTASAADLWLAGGLSATPVAGELLTPTWRVGVAGGLVNPWVTVAYVSFDSALFGTDIDGFALMPRVGARIDFSRPDGEHAPTAFLGLTATTRIVGLTDDDEPWTEDAEASADIPYGIGITGGLDAPINPALSLSAEIGGEYYSLGYDFDGESVHASTFNTIAAIAVNLYL